MVCNKQKKSLAQTQQKIFIKIRLSIRIMNHKTFKKKLYSSPKVAHLE
jgi:hypothetical protein